MEYNSQLKIMHISRLLLWDMGRGKGRVSTYLPLKALCDRGHKVWFLTTNKEQESGEVDGVNVKKLRTIIPYLTKRYWSTITDCLNSLFPVLQNSIISLRHKPDVIYAHDVFSALSAFVASRIAGSRYILRLYGVGEISKPFRKMLLYIALKFPADLYIITNDGTSGRMFAEKYGVPPHKICFWVNGADKDWAYKTVDHEFRKTLCPDNERMVLSVCKLSESKQVNVLIKAIPEVVNVYGEVKFVIVGDGEERRKLEDLVRELEMHDFVTFDGAVLHEDVAKYMKACDVFVSMNALSSICNPVLEAMVCGRPVIALNTGTTADLVKDRYSGILINVDETDRLSDRILLLLRDDDLRKTIGENSQRFMLNDWPAWEERVNLEVDLIETLFSDSEKLATTKQRADSVLAKFHDRGSSQTH